MKPHDFLKKLRNADSKIKIGAIFALACLLMILSTKSDSPAGPGQSDSDVEELDTFIPAGFSLVPIEVINSEGLDSMMGRYALVDLFIENKKNPLIKSVRILRSQDREHFAVLVPSEFVQTLLGQGDRFYVSIRSRHDNKTQVITEKPKSKRTIVYEN